MRVEVWVAGRWVVFVVEVWLFFGAAVGEEEVKRGDGGLRSAGVGSWQ